MLWNGMHQISFWRRKTTLAVEFNDTHIRVARLTHSSKASCGHKLDCAEQVMPSAAFANGQVQDAASVVVALQQALTSVICERNLKSYQVALAVAASNVFVAELKLAAELTELQTQQHVELALERQLGVPAEQLYIDYQVVGDPESPIQQIKFVACRRTLLDGYLEVLQRAGLKAVCVQVDCDARLNGVRVLFPAACASPDGLLFAHVESQSLTLALWQAGELIACERNEVALFENSSNDGIGDALVGSALSGNCWPDQTEAVLAELMPQAALMKNGNGQPTPASAAVIRGILQFVTSMAASDLTRPWILSKQVELDSLPFNAELVTAAEAEVQINSQLAASLNDDPLQLLVVAGLAAHGHKSLGVS